MENFAIGITNINIIKDMIDSKRDENREKDFVMILFNFLKMILKIIKI